MKQVDQAHRDHQRKTYRLHFPSTLEPTSVTAWVRSISGTLRSSRTRLTGVPTVAFELWATSAGIEHRVKVPWQHADYVVSQLRSLVPGIRVTPEDEFPRRLWTRGVEVGLTHTSRQLRIFSAADISASLLASVQALESDETVVMQWVITPAIPTHPPIHQDARSHHINARTLMNGDLANRDEVRDRRAKLEEPNVLAVLRVGAVARTDVRANHLIYRVRASLASTRSPSTRFHKRWVSRETLQKRIDRTSASAIFPMQLSATELTALIAWPIGNPFVSGLPPTLSRQLPASDVVPREGRVVGRSNFPGNERPIALGFEDGRRHVHVMGPTGVGKTVLLGNMLRHDIQQGYGVILIESKGDLFHAATNYVPWDRLDDVILLDVTDRKHPVGFNILQQGDPRVVVDEIVALFQHLYSDARSVWTQEVLYHGLLTLITDPRLTFIDLAPLLVPMTSDEIAWSDALIRSLKDRELRNFWQRFHNQPRTAQDRITQPVMDRIWQLNARPEIRHIIGQSDGGLNIADVLASNKILLVNLSGLPEKSASLFGTLVMNAIWHGVKSTKSPKPNFLYVDEFQSLTNLPVDAEDMLAKARSFGLGMTLAHQHLNQLPHDLRQAVSANTATKLVFQTNADDATAMARDFGSSVSAEDFMHLGQYEVLARIATPNGISAPLTLTTSEPLPGHNFAPELTSHSRASYSRPSHEVEQEITARRTPAKAPQTRRPHIGSNPEWGKDPTT